MKYVLSPLRRNAILLVFLSLPLMVTAAEPASQKKTKSETEDNVVLSGVVVDEQDQPAEGVKVFVEWQYPEQDRAETKTDKQGRFTLRVSAQSVRHQAVQAVVNSPPQMAQHALPWVIKGKDPSLGKLRLQLQPAQRVELHVVDATGKPIADAKTGIMGDYRIWGTRETDSKGQVVYHVPHDVKIKYVFALSDRHGADYKAYVLPRGQSGDKITRPPALPDHSVQLKLEGAQPLRVQLKEPDGTPIAGVNVSPWYIKKPDQPQDLNLSYFYKLIQQTTDAEGNVVFGWIPRWHQTPLTIWPRDQEHVHQRGSYDPKTGEGTLTIKLEKLVPISGKITLPDGSPAKGISVSASGEGYQFDSFRKSAHTDEQGRYVIKAAPNQVYLVVVNDKKWASAPHTGFALWPDKPIENLDFQLRPATRLFGRVTVGSQNEPVKGQRIHVYQYGQDANNMQGVKLPNPENSNKWVQPITVHSTSTDENGKFELSVGDGKFDIRGPAQIAVQRTNTVQKFEIAGESEKEFNFHAVRPEKGILEGTIVAGNPPQPVPDAEVTGIYRASLAGGDMKATTDKSGKFKVERELHRTVIYARSQDKKLAGVVEIGPDDKTVTVSLRPLGTASGQLVDAKTKQPMQEREISYGVKVHLGNNNAPWRTSFGGKTTTDQEGRFEISNLVLGQKYDINLVIRPKDNPNRISWRSVETVKAEESQPIDLGVLEVKPPPKPYKPPTLEERIAKAFNVEGTPLERFAKSKRDAKITMQHLLILFGDPQSEAVKQFMTLRYQDQDVRKELYSFLVMAVDTSADKRDAAQELAKTLGKNLDGVHADFSLVITDEQGKPIANADAGSLSTDGKINKEKILALLKAHTVPTLDAQELLATALKQAKKENKRIIIQETATWCGPCRLLSRFLVKERELWERDYLWIKIDHRWTGSREMMKTMRAGAQGGIPWWAILDQDGKVLVTSNDEEGTNIGFPGEQSGHEHFRSMLEKTAIRLTPMDINTLVESLKQNE
ncbi:carboxypeptidase regulatory-like domain-containing protein [Gimesia fumaroli]|uniref:Nickel uptake substrate-specific transmembrane region n=1 Tax=Gimesia fumaroli TaxID=2527976 RepID=A0A518I4R9_9PLAN|nr:carboxypeptidase regulatory-like domain-containing protein [Gimesia fumaroli]QDV48104.1 Nickel uptake substrate-specific transmembrane region [Gimesia fumaroli]